MSSPTNNDDVIDSRDIIARIEELANDDDRTEDETDELASLVALAEQGEGCSDWSYGEALIRDSYFQDYAQELADDIGAVPADVSWPLTCIDWAQAARELQYDYTGVEFDGVTYWVR